MHGSVILRTLTWYVVVEKGGRIYDIFSSYLAFI